MEYIAEITAELNGYPGYEKLILKQGDFGDRYVCITLLKNGVPITIGSELTPRIAMCKPDGTQVLVDENIEQLGDGKLKVLILPQMSVAAGQGQLEVSLYRQAALLSTAVIDVLIYPSALSMVKIASSDEYQALVDALAQIAPAIDEEKVRQEAEEERIKNEIVRQKQEVERENITKEAVENVNYTVQDMIDRRDRGEFNGKDGIITQLEPGIFALSVRNGHLILTHNTGEPAPPLKIVDGRLKYIIGEE